MASLDKSTLLCYNTLRQKAFLEVFINTKTKESALFALGVAMCFGGGYFVRKIFKLNWKLGNLISAGTGICGGSAVAAIGLGTSITDFKKAGLAPMFYGVTIDTLVTLTALGVIWLMGLM